MEELGEILGVTAPTAHTSVRHLLRKGYLVRRDRRKRGLAIARTPADEIPRQVAVPIVRELRDGVPNLAVDDVDRVALDSYLVGHGRFFAWRVEGNDMSGDGVRDGDVVVVRWIKLANDGNLVLARIGDDVMVRRLRFGAAGVFLDAGKRGVGTIEIVHDLLPVFGVVGPVVATIRFGDGD